MANAHHSSEKYAQIGAKLKGRKRSLLTRQRISQALKGHSFTEETLSKMRGRKRSPEFCARMSRLAKNRVPWNKGKTGIYSSETIEKIRAANLGRKIPEDVRERLRNSMIDFFKSKDSSYIPPKIQESEKYRRHEATRKQRMRMNGGKHSKSQWEHLKGVYNYECQICKRSEPDIQLTKDHIISVKNGGSNDISNIQPLCRSCNSRKR